MRRKYGWIPVEERYPENDNYILLSFKNFSCPQVGRYEEDENGGAFYLGDEQETCVSQDLFVNAWQPLPKSYTELAARQNKKPEKKKNPGKPKKRVDRSIVQVSAEKLWELYITDGLTIEQTAERLDVSSATVKALMKKHNVPSRPKGPRKGVKKNQPVAENVEPEKKPVAAVGIKCTDEVMKTCMYVNTNGAISCDYIGVTGHMRGCSPDNCTRYKKQEGTRKKRIEL